MIQLLEQELFTFGVTDQFATGAVALLPYTEMYRCCQTGLSRRAAEHLLAKFVRYDIVEPVFENHKFYFRIKNE